ncbi:Pyruvate/Phosphoenolpyruvate kinase-like domain-containing protein [Crepidotus variabilis]|uniref:Pyruvate/Phosphoenolpyruvate kinase-like domain-containing protein n=1 Tax=Crepidotus variabilis TaxID=179855 RepID=A0A9P6EST3_9AGAR|nr:Pyruvate/Phosphoenolpyruvate kinase-like domain-containing protein [Crepidotus variabilis]
MLALLRNYHRGAPSPKPTLFPTISSRAFHKNVSHLHRSYLYVPCSSEKMLEKSLKCGSDVVIYDLEDSVSPKPEDKAAARRRLKSFLRDRSESGLKQMNVSVRVNSVSTPLFQQDIADIVSESLVDSIVLPKIHSKDDLDIVAAAVSRARTNFDQKPLEIIPSIESAKGMFNIGSIAAWSPSATGNSRGGVISALMFAAEDYCADTKIIRTITRHELLYTRSQIVITAKAFGLEAIDMVCINYKDPEFLKDEASEARRLGFTGKQAIHPTQIEVINKAFVPTAEEIHLAARIVKAMDEAHGAQRGAVGLDGVMIDAPMILQAQITLKVAKDAGLDIPSV